MADSTGSKSRSSEQFSKSYLRAIDKHPAIAAKIAPKIKNDVKLRLEQIVGELNQKGVPVGAENWAAIANFLHKTLKDDSFNSLREPLDRQFRKLFGGLVQKKIDTASKVIGQSEKELEDYVVQNLGKIKQGLKFVARQRELPDGSRLDVQADDSGVQTILELKGCDWNASNRNNVIELQGEVNKYLNQIDNSKAIIVVPNYSIEIHASLKNRIKEQKVSAYTHRRLEDGSYEFSQVDFSYFEELIKSGASKLTQPKPQEKTIETTIGFTIPQELSQQPQGFTINELLPRSVGKSRAQKKKPKLFAPEELKAARPAVSEKERIVISDYLTKLEQLVGTPNPVPDELKNHIEGVWISMKKDENNFSIEIKQNSADYLKSLFSDWDPASLFGLKENSGWRFDETWRSLYPATKKPLIFEVLDFRISRFAEFCDKMDLESKIFFERVNKGIANLNSKEPVARTESDTELVRELEALKKDVAAMNSLYTSEKIAFTTRIETLKQLRDSWPYEQSENWPLIACYATLYVNYPKNKIMTYEIHEYSTETLKQILNCAREMFETKGTIKCDDENLGRQPLKAMSDYLSLHKKIQVSKKQYSRLLACQKNEYLEQLLLEIRENREFASTQPAPIDIFERFDESTKKEYESILDHYSAISGKSSDRYDTKEGLTDLELTKIWRKQAEKDLWDIQQFVAKVKRSKVYNLLQELGEVDPYAKKAANSMLVSIECARKHSTVDNFIKQEELYKLDQDIAFDYVQSYLGEYTTKTVDAFLDFIDAEKIIYNSIINSCFEVQNMQTSAIKTKAEEAAGAVLQQNLEQEKLLHSQLYELVLPSKYREWISEDAKDYIKNFVATDLELLKLSDDQKIQLAGEIKHSKWYMPLHDKELPNEKLYLFFDKIFLKFYDTKDNGAPDRDKIAKYFKSVCEPALEQKPLNKQSKL